MTASERIELERLRIERKRIELEIAREQNRCGNNMQSQLIAELARVAAGHLLPQKLVETEDSVEEPAIEAKPKPKADLAELDRIIDSLPPERIDKELLETTGPMKVSEVANYLDKSVPGINKMWKNGQLYRIPNSSPNLICPRSVILYAAGIPDPRLKDE